MRDQSLLVNINIQMVDSVSASSHRTEPEPVTMQSRGEIVAMLTNGWAGT